MIRVNLAPKGSIKAAAATTSGSADTSSPMALEIVSPEEQRTGMVRLFIVLLGPILLYVWQNQNLPQKVTSLSQKQQLYNQLSTKNERAKSAVDEMKKYKEEQAKLQEQFNSIEDLQKDRLREVRILDLVQREIPERMWLTKLELKDTTLGISGMVVSDSDLTAFMDALSKSIFIEEVNLVKTSESAIGKIPAKEFSISCILLKNEQRGSQRQGKKSGGEG